MITASGHRKGKVSVSVKVGNHEVISDVEAKSGGEDTGMSPHELVLSGLVACTVMTVQMYANRKQWPLKSTEVTATILSEGKEGTVIAREVHFVGDLDEEQRKRLADIAEKCPVHRLLEGSIKIQTEIK
jgi:putative redox protein